MNTQHFRPSLTEPGVKYFLGETLKKCHEQRTELDYYMLNLGLLGVFISCFIPRPPVSIPAKR